MKIYQIIEHIHNSDLDITVNNITISTVYFHTLLRRYLTLDIDVKNYSEFRELWHNYYSMRKQDIKCMLNAYNLDYSPLENYNKESVVTNNATLTSDGTSKTEFLNDVINTSEKTTYNSDVLHISDKITTKNSDNLTTVENLSQNTNTMREQTKGNIGVTTSQQMLKSEYEVRNINIYDVILSWFINAYAYW